MEVFNKATISEWISNKEQTKIYFSFTSKFKIMKKESSEIVASFKYYVPAKKERIKNHKNTEKVRKF
jgi:hypothetical protein